jgi:phosphatidate cytidylyltransferase
MGVWASDIGAYFAGKAIGGPKLAPEISPKKTWAGFFGGLVSSAVFLILYTLYIGPAFTRWTGYDLVVLDHVPLAVVAVIGASITLSGQAGDLLESYQKRKANMKDSGSLIPGHGGMLDRIDSLMLASPFFLLTLKVFSI